MLVGCCLGLLVWEFARLRVLLYYVLFVCVVASVECLLIYFLCFYFAYLVVWRSFTCLLFSLIVCVVGVCCLVCVCHV